LTDGWIDACATGDIDEEDVIAFEHNGHEYALYRTEDDRFFATDGLCTHEQVSLADGLVMGSIIECPKHNGRFDFTTGQTRGGPVCEHLKTYETQVRGGRLFIRTG